MLSNLIIRLISIQFVAVLTFASVVTDENGYMKQIQWTRTDLTYAVIGNVGAKNQTTVDSVERTVREAFSEWERNSCFRFRRINNLGISQNESWQMSDVKIVFTNDKYIQINF